MFNRLTIGANFEGGVASNLGGLDVPPKLFHKFLREAILDSHIPIGKVVGFSVKDSSSLKLNSAVKRHTSLLESLPEVATNFSDLTVLNRSPIIVKAMTEGNSYTKDTLRLSMSGDKDIPFITDREYFCTKTNEEASINLVIRTACGFQDLKENSDFMSQCKIKNRFSYFPVQSYHSLCEYVRILPLGSDGVIRYKLYNGMTDKMLKDCILYLAGVVNAHIQGGAIAPQLQVIGKEDLEWALSYVQ